MFISELERTRNREKVSAQIEMPGDTFSGGDKLNFAVKWEN